MIKQSSGPRKRGQKTSQQQYLLYLDALDYDEMMRTNVINPLVPENYLQMKWDALTVSLNSCGSGPQLVKKKWERRFQQWKYFVREKSRSIDKHRKVSGRGSKGELSNIEIRALDIWSRPAIVGNPITMPVKSHDYEGELEDVNTISHEEIRSIKTEVDINISDQDTVPEEPCHSPPTTPPTIEPPLIKKRRRNETKEVPDENMDIWSQQISALTESIRKFTEVKEKELRLTEEYRAKKLALEERKLQIKERQKNV